MNRIAFPLLALAALGAPLAASVTYVPAAMDTTTGGVHLRSEIWVANPDPLTQGVTTYFIGAGTDGTVRPEGDPPVTFVLGGATALLPTAAPLTRGLLEIGGAPALSTRATIASLSGETVLHRVEMPMLSSRNALDAGATAWLVGLSDDASTSTSVGVINLAKVATTCSASAYGAAGEIYVQNVVFGLPPLTMAQFDDVYALLGQSSVAAGARISITCDQLYWSYALRVAAPGGELEFFAPAVSILASTLTPPSTSQDREFSLPGEFLDCNAGNADFRFDLPFEAEEEFQKVEIQFDVYVSGWDPDKPDGWHTVLWFNNGPDWDQMGAYMNLLPGTNKVKLQSNFGDGTDFQKSPVPGTGEWYHVLWESNLSGEHAFYYKIVRISNGVTVNGALVDNSYTRFFAEPGGFVSLGTQTSDGPESHTYGWKFKDLHVKYFKSGL